MKNILLPLLCLLPTNRQSGGLWQWAYPQNKKAPWSGEFTPQKRQSTIMFIIFLDFFDGCVNFPFRTSEMKCDY